MMTAWKSVVGTDDTVLNGGDVALAAGQPRSAALPGRGRRPGAAVAAASPGRGGAPRPAPTRRARGCSSWTSAFGFPRVADASDSDGVLGHTGPEVDGIPPTRPSSRSGSTRPRAAARRRRSWSGGAAWSSAPAPSESCVAVRREVGLRCATGRGRREPWPARQIVDGPGPVRAGLRGSELPLLTCRSPPVGAPPMKPPREVNRSPLIRPVICHVAPMCGELKSSRADPWFSRPGHRATRAARPARR